MKGWAAVAGRTWRLRGAVAAIVLAGFASLAGAHPASAVASPDWVETSGSRATRYPAERYVIGYGQARGRDAEVRARQAAMASLAQAVHVRIEFELKDDRREGASGFDERVATSTRTSSELELQDVRFEIFRDPRRVHALAVVERGPAGVRRRALRDRALVRAEACLADAELSREAGDAELAERQLARCRRVHAEAVQHDAVASALRDAAPDPEVGARLDRVVRRLERAERRREGAPATSLGEVADRLAAQLVDQGLRRSRRLDVAPFVDSKTTLPSPFGQAMAVELERALAEAWNADRSGGRDPRRIELEGTHFEIGPEARPSDGPSRGSSQGTSDGTGEGAGGGTSEWTGQGTSTEWRDGSADASAVRITVIARGFGTGTLVASAAASLPRKAVPAGLGLRPENWQPALAQRARLQAVPDAPAHVQARPALRVELWTDRGRERVSYTEGESIRVFLRVSGPAWVRLSYVLSNGLTVPIEDALRIDADRAHTAIAVPAHLEVVAPFGVEMLHAAAFSRPPTPLTTRRVTVAGETYDVVDDGIDALVRARGVRVRRGEAVAEDVLTITTLAAATDELRPRDGR